MTSKSKSNVPKFLLTSWSSDFRGICVNLPSQNLFLWLYQDHRNELTWSWTSYQENKAPLNSSDTFCIIFNKCGCISYIFPTIKCNASHRGLVYTALIASCFVPLLQFLKKYIVSFFLVHAVMFVQCEYSTLKENSCFLCETIKWLTRTVSIGGW